MKRQMTQFVILAATLASLAGCYRTSIQNGQGPQGTHSGFDQRWYHGLIGLIDLSGPIMLEQVCPQGEWSDIDVRTTFLNGLVGRMIPFYTPQSVTIRCRNGTAYDTTLNQEGKVIGLLPRVPSPQQP